GPGRLCPRGVRPSGAARVWPRQRAELGPAAPQPRALELNALNAAPNPAASLPQPLAPAARRAALAVLDDVLARNAPLDESLAARLDGRMEARDRAFARHLAATTLRRLGQIDALIAAFVQRPLPKEAHTARN